MHVVQHLRPVDAVAEGDVVEGDFAADRRQCGAARIEGRLRRRIEESPSRAIEMRAWWKSCQIAAMRSTGELTRPAKMLNATSSPTVSWPLITSWAPK
jgi:hypothetical protein